MFLQKDEYSIAHLKPNYSMYDIVIIWAGASWIFAAIHAPKNLKKVILEKNKKLWVKVLLSWWERCNVSNIDIHPEQDYFWKNKKALLWLFKKFSNYDMISWLEERWIETHIEDRGRIILKSWKSADLVELLTRELRKNNVEIISEFSATDIEKNDDVFTITSPERTITAKKVIIASGGKSFAQVGTDWWGYSMAEKFWIVVVAPYKWLCWIVTREDLSSISGSTLFLTLELFDGTKKIYEEYGSFLFTHFGLSGPLVFNGVLKIGEHIRNKWIDTEEEIVYIKENISIHLVFNAENLTKKVEKFFELTPENMEKTLHINDLRSWAEAKVTGGWVLLDELTNTFESKKVPGLYFVWEVLDITGKTWGFNLQSAWSEGYVVWKSLLTE